MIDYKKIILELINDYKHLGEKKVDKGTLLVAKAPHLAPQAWLFKIYHSLSEKKLKKLSKSLDVEIPEEYKLFLSQLNGVKFFNTTLTLDGYKLNNSRSLDVWQPFDLGLMNVYERPLDAGDNIFFIGGYDWDGSLLYINKDDNKIYRCAEDSIEPLNKWENLEELIINEFNRLKKLYTSEGVEINEDIETIPKENLT